MMVGHLLWWVILIAVIIFLSILISVYEKYFTSKLSKAFFPVIVILFLTFPFIFNFFTSQVYIVKGDNEHSRCYLFGARNFELNNGKSVKLYSSFRNNIVINDVDSLLTCSEQNYSRSGYYSGLGKRLYEEYQPYSVNFVSHRVDYFPGESVPSSISSSFRNWRYYLTIVPKRDEP